VTDRQKLVVVKGFHTFVWFLIEACVLSIVGAGVRGRTDKRVAIAGAIVGGEMLVFAANGFHCPLTAVAESLGAEDGSVTDIYLPPVIARNLPAIHVPVIGLAVALHARNLRRRRPLPRR
jgi:hypothetical protein